MVGVESDRANAERRPVLVQHGIALHHAWTRSCTGPGVPATTAEAQAAEIRGVRVCFLAGRQETGADCGSCATACPPDRATTETQHGLSAAVAESLRSVVRPRDRQRAPSARPSLRHDPSAATWTGARLHQPDVPVDAAALVEPALVARRVDAHDQRRSRPPKCANWFRSVEEAPCSRSLWRPRQWPLSQTRLLRYTPSNSTHSARRGPRRAG